MTSTQFINDMQLVGTYLEGIAKSKKLSLRDVSKGTGLSVNSIKVVFTGKMGTLQTYQAVSEYLGTSFSQAVIAACTASVTLQPSNVPSSA